jgi:protein phosphatase
MQELDPQPELCVEDDSAGEAVRATWSVTRDTLAAVVGSKTATVDDKVFAFVRELAMRGAVLSRGVLRDHEEAPFGAAPDRTCPLIFAGYLAAALRARLPCCGMIATRRRRERRTARNATGQRKGRQRKGRTARTPPSDWVHGAGETDVGHVRDQNEDVLIVEPELGLYAVLDGMGGANAGDVAARMAAECISDYVRQETDLRRRDPERLLRYAVHHASNAVIDAGESIAEYRGMRTTAVVCLVVDPTRVLVAHVGDSRAYLLRDGELTALTRDHTLVQELVEEGRLTPRGARRSRRRHLLTRALGRTSVLLKVDVWDQTLRPGDRLLLCSDGLHGYTPARSIRRVLAADRTPAQVAHELVALVLRGRAPDNTSAVVISVNGGQAREVGRQVVKRPGVRDAGGLDPLPWTPSERRILCPRWKPSAAAGRAGRASAGGSPMSSRQAPCAWSSTNRRRWPRSHATST